MTTRHFFIGMTSWDPLVVCGGKLAPFLLSIWNIPGKKCNRQLGLDVSRARAGVPRLGVGSGVLTRR